VLSDGTNTYLYGAGRIAQQHNNVTEYYLADALGSVRQLTDSSGEVVLARAYDPYGSLVENNAYDGVVTPYGYTGEYTDASGMVYLRARYYSPVQGRFVSKDVWEGNYNNPLSLNRWGYVEGNPINYSDPSGYYTYNREYAANYAMIWDHTSGLDPEYDFSATSEGIDLSNECTLFASSVLYEGGVRDPRKDPKPKATDNSDYNPPYWNISILKKDGWIWTYGYQGITWFRTPPFRKFATQIIGDSMFLYQNPPQYNDKLVYGENGIIDENWEKLLCSMQGIIQKGDLVFYKGKDDEDWGHVAVVIGWGFPTNWGDKSKPSSFVMIGNKYMDIETLQNKCRDFTEITPRPIVVERTGFIGYEGFRSLDNTLKPVQTINIVHVKDYIGKH
jgi:RHS repeat-associated protein